MADRLKGKIAVVTGGNSGIGLASAKLFAAEGAKVVITGRRKPELDAAVAQIGSAASAVQGDVSNLADLDRLYAEVKSRHGRIDVLFANAGAYEPVPFGQVTEAHFDRLFAINVKGALFCVQKALPLIPDGGSIILTGSVVGSKGLEALSVYSATKAAVRSFVRCWATDLKSRAIRVNAVSPGPIDTPGLFEMAKTEEALDAMKAGFAASIPLGRMGESIEVANAALFLASDESSFVTGIELFVDGGFAQV